MDRVVFQQLDFDLAERIMASGPIRRPKPVKTQSTPRPADTYRGARRNLPRQRRAEELAAKRAAKRAVCSP